MKRRKRKIAQSDEERKKALGNVLGIWYADVDNEIEKDVLGDFIYVWRRDKSSWLVLTKDEAYDMIIDILLNGVQENMWDIDVKSWLRDCFIEKIEEKGGRGAFLDIYGKERESNGFYIYRIS